MNYFANMRQEWIAEMLSVYGFINREHLIRKFGISQPKASQDLTLYQERNPEEVRYDPRHRCYLASWTKPVQGRVYAIVSDGS